MKVIRKDIGYYLENESRLKALSHEILDKWIVRCPASFLLHLAKARKFILDGEPLPQKQLHLLAALSPDRITLQKVLNQPPRRLKHTLPSTDSTIPKKIPTESPNDTVPSSQNITIVAEDTKASTESDDSLPKLKQRKAPPTPSTKAKQSKKKPMKPKSPNTIAKSKKEPESFTEWLLALQSPSITTKPSGAKSKKPTTPKTQKRLKRALKKIKSSTAEPVSETYADLLASQGHVRRAKEIYKKLIAQYPEKKNIFAQKLENLKK